MNGMAIILAAGEGKRMNSDLPKVLHEVAGKPLLEHVGDAAHASGVGRIVVVIGKGADRVRETFASRGWDFVEQPERLGTADAVRRAEQQLRGFDGEVIVLAGDVPLLRGETLATMRRRHREEGASVTVLTARLPDPAGYGRVLRSEAGEFLGIVEHKDATPEQRAVDEVNSSVYCFEARDLVSVLGRITNDNAQGEYYLTDAVELLRDEGKKAIAVEAAAPEEILGVNDRAQLEEIERILAGRRGSTEGIS